MGLQVDGPIAGRAYKRREEGLITEGRGAYKRREGGGLISGGMRRGVGYKRQFTVSVKHQTRRSREYSK